MKNYIFLTGNFSSWNIAGFVNKGFLFATSSQKIKSHVVESQITLLVWPCLSLTEKQCKINQMVIFNDSVSKFYQCSIQRFWWGISMFFSICLRQKKKKNAEAIKFLGILKKYVPKNKINFRLKKIVYCFIHRCLYSLFIHFLFSYISF